MSRTPLMSMLRGMAAKVDADARLERGEPMIDRRRMLQGAAGLAATTAIGARPAVALASGTPRIAVVGAGLAGLTAAYRLKQAGYSPVVFEGNTRLGGRCYTVRDVFANGQLAEHGGEFIDTDHTEIRSLAGELGLQLDDVLKAQPPGTTELYRFNDQRYTLADATVDFQAVYPVLQRQNTALGDAINYKQSTAAAQRFDTITIRQWIATYVPGGATSKLGQLLDNAFSEEDAADTDLQSSLNLIYTLAPDRKNNFNLYYTGSDQRFHIHGGNDQIPTILGAKLDVRTGAALVAIAKLSDGRIRLTLKSDTATRDVVFDRVILALPFAVMRAAVDYSAAGFQPLKQRSIQELGMGSSVKTQLQFSRRLWNSLGCTGETRLVSKAFQTSWDVTRAQAGQQGIFNFWSGGSQAIFDGKIDTDRLARLLLADVNPILPGLAGLWNGRISVDVWKQNPWSRGSYSYYGPGYQTNLFGIEKVPEGHCFFAGEHTWSQSGFLNAGVASGDRAAKQVMQSLTM